MHLRHRKRGVHEFLGHVFHVIEGTQLRVSLHTHRGDSRVEAAARDSKSPQCELWMCGLPQRWLCPEARCPLRCQSKPRGWSPRGRCCKHEPRWKTESTASSGLIQATFSPLQRLSTCTNLRNGPKSRWPNRDKCERRKSVWAEVVLTGPPQVSRDLLTYALIV